MGGALASDGSSADAALATVPSEELTDANAWAAPPSERPAVVASMRNARRFEIDRRPLGIVLISRLRHQIGLALALLAFSQLLDMAPPAGLDASGWATFCVFLLCATLWATSVLPMAVTSLLAIALIPMLGILPARETYAFFGSKVVFFILGAFMLAAALMASGLSARIATHVVRRFGGSPRRLVMAIFLLGASASTVMSIHAVAAMLFPIVRDIAKALRLVPGRSELGRALFFALAWGCIIGGALTILGGGRAPLGIGILEEVTSERSTIGFVEYSLYTWPLVAMLLLTGAALLWRFEPEVTDMSAARDVLERELKAMGKPTVRERAVGLVLVVTVGLWATTGDTLGLANIALVSMAALFAVGAVGWQDVEKNVSWGIVVMYGGAISLGAAMERTGAAEWVTAQLLSGLDLGPTALMLALAVLSAALTEVMSNSAVVAMLMPPALGLADAYGVDPRAMTLCIVLPSNFSYVFPISTPTMGIAWSGGHFDQRLVASRGLVLHAAAAAGMAVLILVWWPLLSLETG